MSGAVVALASAWPLIVSVPESYRRACRLLDLDVTAESLLAASYVLTALLFGTGVTASVLGGSQVGAITAFSLAGLSLAGGRYGVELAAQARRVRALGTAPSLVTRLVLAVELWPTTERAAAFASETGSGLLAERLAAHHRRARDTPQSGLRAFAEEWGATFPALERALTGIERAAVAPADERNEILATTRRLLLEGTREEMAAFAASLRIPTTGLYAFGVLLPLALVSLVPAAGMAGIPVTRSLLVAAYVVVLPIGVLVAAAWILARRPVAFPPVVVSRSHPDVPDSPWMGILAGLVAGVGCLGIGAPVLPPWGVPVAAVGVGAGTTLVGVFRPVVGVRERVVAVESGLPAALQGLGRRLDRGEAVESALPAVADESQAPLAGVLESAANRQRRLGVTVEEAFCGECGPLTTLPSRRVRDTASLLSVAATVGPPAGSVLTEMGDHLSDLREVEQETRRDLAQITGTLTNTAALFGPLVGGTTVALAGSIGPTGPVSSVPVSVLGPIVGWYVLVLGAVLTALSVGLHRGLDRALVGYRVGLALLAATAAYFAAVAGTGLLV
ncbi:type II secretion system F family protein [Haloarcula pelagica]|uniref:type II secretion system F family protein n=1 Tax=Haloarcula pelagica TaxID=3033389 RepID=UPI0024C43010|nr:type II secretion system protein [Halomicroarcula sp. YJ-61-S]